MTIADPPTQHPVPPPPAPPDLAPDGDRMTASQLARAVGLLGLLVVLTLWAGIWGLVIVLGIVFLVFLHELGHFLAAKRAGMKVTEFFIGFGPRIWSFRRGETEYGIKVAPLGAYVKIIGMHNLEEVAPEDEARSYRQGSFPDRLSVVLAGPFMNFLQAFVALFVVLAFIGAPSGSLTKQANPTRWKIDKVFPGTGAAEAGLKPGDKIVAIDGVVVRRFDDIPSLITAKDDSTKPIGKSVRVTYLRAGARHTVTVALHPYTSPGTTTKSCCLGIDEYMLDWTPKKVSLVSAVPKTFEGMASITWRSLAALGHFFSPHGVSNFGRQVTHATSNRAAAQHGVTTVPARSTAADASKPAPVPAQDQDRLVSLIGVFSLGKDAAASGATALLILFGLVNISLGIVNLVPLLPFDGGHAAVAIYERIQERRRHLTGRYFTDVQRLLPLTYAVVGILLLIFVTTTYLDIVNPLNLN